MPDDATAQAAWDRVRDRYQGLADPTSRFNIQMVNQLRPHWEGRVRPDTSMFKILFTRYGSTGYTAPERVEVLYETADRVRVALLQMAPRRGETEPVGFVVVTGDLVRPDNAGPVVESFLMQLSTED